MLVSNGCSPRRRRLQEIEDSQHRHVDESHQPSYLLAAVTAGRLVLRELDRLVAAKDDVAFESTLSGLRYAEMSICTNPQSAKGEGRT